MATTEYILRFLRKLAPLLRSVPAERDDRRAYRAQLHEALLGKNGLLADNAALGILLAAGVEVGQEIYSRPGVQASLTAALREMTGGDAETAGDTSAAYFIADRIVALFASLHIQPVRLAVDGVPGSGKSTLARKLAERLHMDWRNLDYENIDEVLPLTESGVIYEHHRLLRTQPLDQFDAIIYIDEPVALAKSRILRRGRGGVLVDMMDFDRLKRIGTLAFELAAGEEHAIEGSHVRIKIRPDGGYRLRQRAEAALRGRHIESAGLAPEQQLFLIADDKARSGFLAYVDAGTWQRDVLNGLAAALYHISRRSRRDK